MPSVSIAEPDSCAFAAIDFESAKKQVRPASIGLIASGVINIPFGGLLGGQFWGNLRGVVRPWELPLCGLVASSTLAVGILSIFAGKKMRRRELQRLAVLATYAAMLPLPTARLLYLFPYVIWARVVLGRNAVRAAFDANHVQAQLRNPYRKANEPARLYVGGPAAGLICTSIVNFVIIAILLPGLLMSSDIATARYVFTFVDLPPCRAWSEFSRSSAVSTCAGSNYFRW